MSKVLVVGSSNMDISVFVDELPKRGETLLGSEIKYSFGGKGANQAIACGKLGADIKFLTCVGNDDNGRSIIEYLKNNNVNCDNVKISNDKPTGTAIISVDKNGGNTIVVIQGANLDCDVEYLKENEKEFEDCEYVLIQNEIPLESIYYIIELCSKYNKKLVYNPAPANINMNNELYKYITYITPNETELELMAFKNVESRDIMESVNRLLDLGIKNVLVTLGDKGANLYNKDFMIKSYAHSVKAIDTVAAGDCFNGAFVTALSLGEKEEEALEFANKASGIAVTRKGAQESIPTREEVDNFDSLDIFK